MTDDWQVYDEYHVISEERAGELFAAMLGANRRRRNWRRLWWPWQRGRSYIHMFSTADDQ